MAATLRIRIANESQRGLDEVTRELHGVATASQAVGEQSERAFAPTMAAEYRNELRNVTQELRTLSESVRGSNAVSVSLQSNTKAAREYGLAAQQTTIINEQSQTSFADLGIAVLNAYLHYRAFVAIKENALPVLMKHKAAATAGGVALTGLAAAAGTVVLSYMAVTAAARAVSDSIAFMREHGLNDIKQLEQASDTFSAAWDHLKRTTLSADFVKRLVSASTTLVEDLAGTVGIVDQLIQDIRPKLDFSDLTGSWERIKDTKGWYDLGAAIAAVSQDVVSFLGLKDDSFKLMNVAMRLAGLKTGRDAIEQANARTRSRQQKEEVETFLTGKSTVEDKTDGAMGRVVLQDMQADRARLSSIKAIDDAIEQQRQALLAAADGTAKSTQAIREGKAELNRLIDERQQKLTEQRGLEERIQQLERSGHRAFMDEEADELDSLKKVVDAQKAIVAQLKKAREEHRLTKAVVDDAAARHEALERRKQALIRETTQAARDQARAIEEATRINQELMRAREEDAAKKHQARMDDLRKAIAEARGLMNPQASALEEMRRNVSGPNIARDVIEARVKTALDQKREELRGQGKLDQNFRPVGWTPEERRQNQALANRELSKVERDTRSAGVRDARMNRIDPTEVRNLQDQRLSELAKQAFETNRISKDVYDQLREQIRLDREKFDADNQRANELQRFRSLMAPAGRPQPGNAGVSAIQPQPARDPITAQQRQWAQQAADQRAANQDLRRVMADPRDAPRPVLNRQPRFIDEQEPRRNPRPVAPDQPARNPASAPNRPAPPPPPVNAQPTDGTDPRVAAMFGSAQQSTTAAVGNVGNALNPIASVMQAAAQTAMQASQQAAQAEQLARRLYQQLTANNQRVRAQQQGLTR